MLLFPPVIASLKNILGFLLPLSYKKKAWALEVASPFDVTTLGLFSFHPYAFQKLPITPFDFTLFSCIDTSKLLHPEKWGIPLCLLQVLGDLDLSSVVRAALEKIHDEWKLMADSFQVPWCTEPFRNLKLRPGLRCSSRFPWKLSFLGLVKCVPHEAVSSLQQARSESNHS